MHQLFSNDLSLFKHEQRMYKKIFQFLSIPFIKQWDFYVIQLAILLLFLIGHWLSGSSGSVVALCSIFCLYVTCILLHILPNIIQKIIKCILCTYTFIIAILTFWGGLFIKTPDPMYTLLLILQTNKHEATEFFSAYVNLKSIAVFAIVAIALILIIKVLLSKNGRKIIDKSSWAFILFSLFSVSSFYVSGIVYATPFFIPLSKPMSNFVIRDLNDYVIIPKLIETEMDHPTNVIVIIGESFSRSHSSLYQYEKNTNPSLSQFINSHNLFVFPKVTSSRTSTGYAFKDIMSTYSLNSHEEWYTCQTIPTIIKNMGYKTSWFSNQQANGLFDAIPSRYADLCDSVYYTPKGQQFDEELISPVNNYFKNATNNSFMVINLMGSHEDFSSRYPKEFSKFQAEDYNDCEEWQRETLAAYDNAILYNDFVVSEIMRSVKDIDVIVFYFPDHGLDIYESDSHYVGHANGTEKSQQVAKEIPFVIYVSDIYKQKHSIQLKRIENSILHQGCSDNFIYSLTDILGYDISKTNSVKKHSLFYSSPR